MLFAAYAATLRVDAAGGSRYAGDEPHFLLAAESLAEDGGPRPRGRVRDEAAGDGPRGPTAGSSPAGSSSRTGSASRCCSRPPTRSAARRSWCWLLAAVAALAFVLGAALARRVVPDPWATWAALLTGLSPPALAHATAVLPALTAGALLAGAALCALAVRERPLMRSAYGGAALLAVLPWLDPWLLVPAAPVALLLARWTARRGRGLVALGTVELQLASLVFYVVAQRAALRRLHAALRERRGRSRARRRSGDYAERLPRLAELWVDRDVGLLRWAPVLALAFLGAWLLWRSRRERLARLVSEQRDAEHAAFLALAVCAAQVAVAAFVSRSISRARGSRGRSSWRRCRARCRWWRGGCGTRRGPGLCWARSRWARARGWR